MNTIRRLISVCLLLCLTMPIFAQQPDKAKLPIKRVILYSHGVGYFERQGSVTGTQSIDLEFNSGQMNDVLKSLLVLDLNGGRISTVTYDTSKPIDRQLAEFSISLNDSNQKGLTTLIAQMRGARVEVKVGGGAIEGKVVGLEKRRQMQNQNVIEIDALVLVTDAGDVRSYDLNEIRGIRILDAKLRGDLEHYLDILNGTHKKDARNLVISAQGEGKRKILAGYTIEAPIWKTTYRIVIDEKGKPYLQGWAIVDNEQDEDWEDVQLSLVSGLPVSFIQDLQSARYRRRPVVPYKDELALAPQTYEEALTNGNGNAASSSEIVEVTAANPTEMNKTESSTSQDQGRISNLPINRRNFLNFALTGAVSNSVQSAATGQNLGDLFEYKVDHTVTIKRNSSALIPIVTSKVDGESVSIFNEATGMKNPMSGVLLHNTTGLTLEDGPLTVFEGDTYAGEGLLDRLKPDEKRFLTYAADLGTLVSTKLDSKNDQISLVQIISGTIYTSYKQVQTKVYTILNKDAKPKTIIIEHPNRTDWKLTEPKEPYETTENFRRFRVIAAPKTTTQFPVAEEYVQRTSFAISNFTPEMIELYYNRKYINEEVRRQFLKIIDLKQQIAAINTEINIKTQQINGINADQARIRENLKAVGKTEEEKKLISRYTQKLNQGEDELEKLNQEIKTAREKATSLQLELNSLILAIKFENKL